MKFNVEAKPKCHFLFETISVSMNSWITILRRFEFCKKFQPPKTQCVEIWEKKLYVKGFLYVQKVIK